jgi:hypothetical protein
MPSPTIGSTKPEETLTDLLLEFLEVAVHEFM